MPVNEKILFGSFQYLFFSKNYNLRYFVIGNVVRKSWCFRGEKYRFPKVGGSNKYPKYRFIDPWLEDYEFRPS
jgi:hypothetical protein